MVVAYDVDEEEQELETRGAGEKRWYVLFMCLSSLFFFAVLTLCLLSEDAPAWRMFAPDFLGTVETVVCADGEEDHNAIIRSNFRVPTEAALAVELPPGKGIIWKVFHL